MVNMLQLLQRQITKTSRIRILNIIVQDNEYNASSESIPNDLWTREQYTPLSAFEAKLSATNQHVFMKFWHF